jgi:hypothetical protein
LVPLSQIFYPAFSRSLTAVNPDETQLCLVFRLLGLDHRRRAWVSVPGRSIGNRPGFHYRGPTWRFRSGSGIFTLAAGAELFEVSRNLESFVVSAGLISSLEDSDGGGDAIFRSKIAIANVTTLEAGVPLTFAEFLVWLIVGLLGGSAAGMIVKRKRKGFGFFTNLALAGC